MTSMDHLQIIITIIQLVTSSPAMDRGRIINKWWRETESPLERDATGVLRLI
jgi:hypothetical protein